MKILYKCDCGNIAESCVSNFEQKKVYACKKCNAGKINSLTKRISLEEIEEKLKKKGLDVIKVTGYNGVLSESEWNLKCKYNHSFKRSGNHIQKTQYCPVCFTGSSEECLVRDLLEIHFNKKFPNVRPDFLKSEFSKRNLELDMYNDDLKMAFEYNGIQHYKPIYGEKRLEISKRNDAEKERLCDKNGIKLIVIKQCETKFNDKKEFLKNISSVLKLHNIHISEEDLNKTINKKRIFKNKDLEKIESLLLENNKILISKTYLNSKSKVDFKCLCCKNVSTVSVSTIMNLKTTPRKNCTKCCFSAKKEKAELRHESIALNYCEKNEYHFEELIKNKKNQNVGFKYRDKNNEIKIFGSKRYRKYLKEHNGNI